jgi:transglutaminase-like putative cysteine protease
MKRIPYGQLLAAAGLVALGGLGFSNVFELKSVLLPVVAAAAGSVLVAIVVRRFRPRPHAIWSVAASLAAFLVVVNLFLLRGEAALGVIPTPDSLSTLVHGLVSGWRDILAATVPAPGRGSLLVLPVALTWLAGLMTAEIVLRTRRILLPIAPATVLGCTAIAFSLSASGSWGAGPAVFLVLAGTLVATRSQSFAVEPLAYDRRTANSSTATADTGNEAVVVSYDEARGAAARDQRGLLQHRLIMTVPFVLVLALISPLLAGALPFVDSSHPYQFRDDYQPPSSQQDQLNPLARIGAPDRSTDFTVTLDRVPDGTLRFRTAVLDKFDGQRWNAGGTQVTAGPQIPAGAIVTAPTIRVAQHIQINHLDDNWLPSLDRPTTLTSASTSDGFGVDPLSATLTAAAKTADGLDYTVISDVAAVDPSVIETAGVATDGGARSAVDFNHPLPADLAARRDAIMGQASTPAQQLFRLLAYFHNNTTVNSKTSTDSGIPFKLVPADQNTATGQTLGNLAQFLDQTGATRNGTAEQFALAFVIFARSQGFPARLAVGYIPTKPIEAGTPYPMSSDELTAWPEIALAGLGWVPFDPSPTEKSSADLSVQEKKLDASVNSAVQQSANTNTPPPAENPNATAPPRGSHDYRVLAAAMVVLFALLVAASVMVTPVARKRRRRRKRRDADSTADQVVGAWNEAVDRLVEIGLDDSALLTTQEVARAGEGLAGPEVAGDLASLGSAANSALHRQMPPEGTDVDAAWDLSDGISRCVRAGLTSRARARARLSRRPLVGANRRP